MIDWAGLGVVLLLGGATALLWWSADWLIEWWTGRSVRK